MNASVAAIEQRDPTTSGHSFRVADLSVALARVLPQASRSDLIRFDPTDARLRELRYASLLHDFGKVGVREHVLMKAKKLYDWEFSELRYRLALAEQTLRADYSLAMDLLNAFIEVARNDKEEEVGRFELLYELRRLLVKNLKGDLNRPIIDQLIDQETPLPLSYPDIMTRLESGEDCASQQFAWYGHVLAGDMDSANQIASELWDKGSRGLEIAFMAKQLGIPHPP